MADEATILINADGTYADASPSAFTLLGVELREFIASLRERDQRLFAAKQQSGRAIN
jgi:hypothetical protein